VNCPGSISKHMNPAAQLIAPKNLSHGRWPFASSSTWSLSLATRGDHGQKGLLRELYVADSLHAFLALLLLLQQFFLPGYVSSSHHFAALHLRCESATATAQYTQSQRRTDRLRHLHAKKHEETRRHTAVRQKTQTEVTGTNSESTRDSKAGAAETARQVLIPSDTNIFRQGFLTSIHTHTRIYPPPTHSPTHSCGRL